MLSNEKQADVSDQMGSSPMESTLGSQRIQRAVVA